MLACYHLLISTKHKVERRLLHYCGTTLCRGTLWFMTVWMYPAQQNMSMFSHFLRIEVVNEHWWIPFFWFSKLRHQSVHPTAAAWVDFWQCLISLDERGRKDVVSSHFNARTFDSSSQTFHALASMVLILLQIAWAVFFSFGLIVLKILQVCTFVFHQLTSLNLETLVWFFCDLCVESLHST